MKKATTITTISNLCDETIFDILSRLMVQDLSPCLLVCKSWYTIIKDPAFVDSHHSRLHQDDPTFIIVHLQIEREPEPERETEATDTDDYSKGLAFTVTSKEELFLLDNRNMTTSPMAKSLNAYLPIPYFEEPCIVGSCNGLFCFKHPTSRHSYLIVNPITKEILHLPRAPRDGAIPAVPTGHGGISKAGYEETGPSGFAFDTTTKTYKVVQTWSSRPNGKVSVLCIDMHTIGTGKWRRREFLDACHFGNAAAVFVNNALHWKIRDEQFRCHVCAFDVGAGTITKLKIPPRDNDADYQSLGTIKGCLASFSEIHGELTVWVMKDYGVDESWTKQCTVSLNRPMDFIYHYWKIFKTLRTMKDGSTLVSDGERLSYFDFEKKEFQVINVQGLPSYTIGGFPGVVAHVGSLVSPKLIAVGNEITSAYPSDDWKEVTDTRPGFWW